jgi:homotetrameric cytidine deaminase
MDETIVGRPAGAAHRRLWLQARAAAVQAYAPYSGLRVGAALATAAGATFTGVNVENASYPVGLCAERAALAAAVTAGERQFAMLAVATDSDAPILPCGACLQALAEFGELDVVVTAPAPDTAPPRTAQPDTAQPDARSGAPIEPRVVALRDLLRAPFRSPRELT